MADALKAGQPVQTALTERSQIIAITLDAIKMLAKVCIDQVAAYVNWTLWPVH